MRRSRNLPQELVDATIDYLHEDRRSLAQCSLVCKSWVPSSSRHLFRELYWPPCLPHPQHPERSKSGTAFPVSCHEPEGQHLAAGFNVLSQYPRIWANAQKLDIVGFHKRCQPHNPLTRSAAMVIAVDDLLSMMDLLPRLHTLTLSYCSLAAPQSPTSSTPRRQLRKLCYEDVANRDSLEVFLSFLSLFKSISTLTLGPLWGPPHGTVVTIPQSPIPTRITRLELRNQYDEEATVFEYFLRHLPVMTDVACLRTLVVHSALLRPIVHFLDATPSITTFSYDIEFPEGPPICHFRHLHTLAIRPYFFVGDPEDRAMTWNGLMHELTVAAAQSPGLRKVEIHLRVVEFLDRPEGVDAIFYAVKNALEHETSDWQALANVLLQFPRLEALEFVFQASTDGPGCLTELQHGDRSVALLREVITSRFPQRLLDMLQVTFMQPQWFD